MFFFQRPASPGSLDVLPERGWCLPSETVTGVVLLHLDRALLHTELTIALAGREDVKATETDSDGDRFHRSVPHVLVDERLRLGQGPLAACDVAVPFTIPMPLGLPPTRHTQFLSDHRGISDGSDVRLTVAYSLTCQLVVRDAGIASLSQQIPLVVAAFPTVRPVGEPREASASRKFRYACLTKSGFCVRASVASNVVDVGTRISAHVWLTLTPPERLRHVTLSLRRTVKTTDKSLRYHDGAVATLCTMRFDKSLLGDAREFVLEMPVDESSAPQVDGKRRTRPFHGTEAFHAFRIAYEIVVECSARGCKPVEARIPVTFVAPEDPVAVAA